LIFTRRSASALGATVGLLAASAAVVATDLGPRMLARLHARHPSVPAVVARAEAVPFASQAFDVVLGAQMWHWVDVRRAAAEAARVLRPGGRLALCWNDVDAAGQRWYEEQQERLEASSPGYTRQYRTRDDAAELLRTGLFDDVRTWSGHWTREVDWPLYERWLRSRSYVQALPDVEAFVAAERASLAEAFPDGRIVEPFRTRLVHARVPPPHPSGS
jgi:SAM-dependent methyltransferase